MENEYTFNKMKSIGIDHYFKYEPCGERAEYADYFEIKDDSENQIIIKMKILMMIWNQELFLIVIKKEKK